MRYQELFDDKAWRKYTGRGFPSRLLEIGADGVTSETQPFPARVECGVCHTGRSRVFAGYYIRAIADDGRSWLGEDGHSLRMALREMQMQLHVDGLSLDAIGLSSKWQESGLSANTGYGYHPDIEGAVHMLDPLPV